MYLVPLMQSKIREQLRNTVKFTVDRSTHAEKIRDFHKWMVAIKKDTLHHVCRKYRHTWGATKNSKPLKCGHTL